MVHVGGYFQHSDGTYSIGGTYGCFGVIAPEQIFETEDKAADFGYNIKRNSYLDNKDNHLKVYKIKGLVPSNKEHNSAKHDIDKARINGTKIGE